MTDDQALKIECIRQAVSHVDIDATGDEIVKLATALYAWASQPPQPPANLLKGQP